MADTDPAEKGIDQLDVLDKYKAAGSIVEQAFDLVRKALYEGMAIRTVCQLGDAFIVKSCASIYSKARTETGDKLDKGVAFPTNVCVNNCASHFCPMDPDPEAAAVLSDGDLVSIQLGAHIDGYATIAAQVMAVRPSKDAPPAPIRGRAADAAAAAYTAADAVLRLMRPGNSNDELTAVIAKVAKDFGVTPLDGVLSHQMKRFVVDGSKVIVNRESLESRVDQWNFEENEVYNLDVVMSTGEGKAIEKNTRGTIYKRQVDVDYKLKMKTSRQVFSEINKSYPTMPFTLRALSDPIRSRMAMKEMLNHNLVTPYPVLYEKDDEYVARCSMTVLITPTQTMVVTKSVRPEVECDKEVKDEQVKALLAMSIEKKKKKKKSKKKVPQGEEADRNENDAMET